MKHIVGFSGGIDSQACARWVLNRFPVDDVILTNSDAGQWEDPFTTEFIDRYSNTIHPVQKINAQISDMWRTEGAAEERGFNGSDPLTFETMVRIKGRPPSRRAQFCTEKLKLLPQKRWIKTTFGVGGRFEGEAYTRYTGVRRQESQSRRSQAILSWDDFYDCELVAPLADWTKEMCFAYVKAHDEEFNPLYTLGFNRVGCAPCINSGRDDIINWAIRRPDAIDKVRLLEQKTGRTFFAPMVPGHRINNIDTVVAWAMSVKRGGTDKQPAFPILFERPICESKYGLCE
jgi:3'-phosphoadenosine 5'-phosphosulfate sulfotransferase (PAPS reductase)/FAD synthetase